MPKVNKKPQTRNAKFGLKKKTRPRMNYEWIGKTIEKKSDPTNRKKRVKIKVKLPQVNRKPLTRKQIFVQKFAFSLHFLFRRDQNNYNMTSKIMKMCEQIFKDRAPIKFKYSELLKTKRSPKIAPAIAVRLLKF